MFGSTSIDLQFLSGVAGIVIIDLILAGDNAVVIALAVRSLPPARRRTGIFLGAGAAVLLRAALTYFVAQLLNVGFIKLAGGVLILWVALKLFLESSGEVRRERPATTVTQAVWLIMIADISMSLDNMLAVGGASHGNPFLLLFGLGLSIPFIVFTSDLLSRLMDRYPVIIAVGAAILGKVAGGMIVTDPIIVHALHPGRAVRYACEAFFAAGVIIAGRSLMPRVAKGEETAGPD